ncbi:MAG: acyl-ACP--UDP-N-acetylglucosamine O-acyltransferase [Hydrogenophilus sp.]|nr:acyl-ACP--UDP-N-acetylglucosamine O-acyltransferase [Hydrogenophilus sp.]
MSVFIHPTAVVDEKAELEEGVVIGPYAIIGKGVHIGARTTVGAHCVVEGETIIGCDNRFFPFCSIGLAPQDKKYGGEPTRLVIGNNNTVREFVTINRGTVQDRGVTTVGDDNWIMAYVHIAHDCVVGSHTIFANHATLAGHVIVEDWAILGGFTGVHQFVRVGAHSFCGVGTVLTQDLPPYVMAAGSPARPHGINREGLKRRGFRPEVIAAIKGAYKTIYRKGLRLEEAVAAIETEVGRFPELGPLVTFLRQPGRGIIR